MYQARPHFTHPRPDTNALALLFVFIYFIYLFFCLVYDAQFFFVTIYKVKKFDA